MSEATETTKITANSWGTELASLAAFRKGGMATNGKGEHNVLAFYHFAMSAGKMRMTATNQEVGMSMEVQGHTEGPEVTRLLPPNFTVAVDAEGAINMTLDDKSIVAQATGHKVRQNTVAADAFVPIPSAAKLQKSFKILPASLKALFSVDTFTAKEEQANWMGLHIIWDGEQAQSYCASGFVMAETTVKIKDNKVAGQVYVNPGHMKHIKHLLEYVDPSAYVTCGFSGSSFVLKSGDIFVWLNTINNKVDLAPVQNAIQKFTPEWTGQCDPATLSRHLKKMKIFGNLGDLDPVTLGFGQGEAIHAMIETETNKGAFVIPAFNTGDKQLTAKHSLVLLLTAVEVVSTNAGLSAKKGTIDLAIDAKGFAVVSTTNEVVSTKLLVYPHVSDNS